MQTLTINRSGEFTVRTSGAYHCGTAEVQAIRYRFSCTAEWERATDHRGFFFDQLRVDKWFQLRLSHTSLSCETLAHWAARELYKLVAAENRNAAITRLCLTLSPAPYAAEVEYAWDRREELKAAAPVWIDTTPAAEPVRIVSDRKSNAWQGGLFQ